MRRGILGGTFDPPHLAHLVGGEAAFRQLELDKVTFLPAGAPWQKGGRELTNGDHRLAMTRASVDDIDYFDVDDQEVRRRGWTYTIDTLAGFAGDEVTLILGADAARGLPSWHQPEAVLSRARIAVLPRPGVSRAEVEEVLPADRADWLEMPELTLSGTALRAHARAGGSLRFLVREGAWAYIQEHGIYV